MLLLLAERMINLWNILPQEVLDTPFIEILDEVCMAFWKKETLKARQDIAPI